MQAGSHVYEGVEVREVREPGQQAIDQDVVAGSHRPHDRLGRLPYRGRQSRRTGCMPAETGAGPCGRHRHLVTHGRGLDKPARMIATSSWRSSIMARSCAPPRSAKLRNAGYRPAWASPWAPHPLVEQRYPRPDVGPDVLPAQATERSGRLSASGRRRYPVPCSMGRPRGRWRCTTTDEGRAQARGPPSSGACPLPLWRRPGFRRSGRPLPGGREAWPISVPAGGGGEG